MAEGQWLRGVPLPGDRPPPPRTKNSSGRPRTTTSTIVNNKKVKQPQLASNSSSSSNPPLRPQPAKNAWGTTTTTRSISGAEAPPRPQAVKTPAPAPAPKENPWGAGGGGGSNKKQVPTKPVASVASPPKQAPAAAAPKVSAWGKQPPQRVAPSSTPPATTHKDATTKPPPSTPSVAAAASSFPPLGAQPQPKRKQQSSTPPNKIAATNSNTAAEQQQQQQQQPRMILQPKQHQPKNSPIQTGAKPKAAPAATAAASVVASEDFPSLGAAAASDFPALGKNVVQQQVVADSRKRTTSATSIAKPSQSTKEKSTNNNSNKTSKKNKANQPKTPAAATATTPATSKATANANKSKNTKKIAVGDPRHSAASLALGVDNRGGGGDFDFFQRMMISGGKKGGGGGEIIKKGRQRLGPRKKKFTSLKKKVLEERLRQWKALHAPPETATDKTSDAATKPKTYTTVCLYGFSNDKDEREDDDEYEEMVDNLRDMAVKVGSTKRVFVPRIINNNNNNAAEGKLPVFVEFDSPEAALAAVGCWDGLVLGGEELQCYPVVEKQKAESANIDDDASSEEATEKKDEEWQQWCITNEQTADEPIEDVPSTTDVFLENAITEDDKEDEECLEESLEDIRMLAAKFGQVDCVELVEQADGLPPCVRVVYVGDANVARAAAAELSKVVIGGQAVAARLNLSSVGEPSFGDNLILLRNVLTDDDLEDEECLNESLNDLRELAQQFGTVQDIALDAGAPVPDGDNAVRIVFSTAEEAKAAASGFDGMVVGGLTVSASSQSTTGGIVPNGTKDGDQKKEDEEEKTLYSGDKLIPERFAECKRVPKIVNSASPRPYATLSKDESAKPLLVEMLGELMRLQQRAAEDKNAKARRRVVMGLREVARGIRSHKVKMVVIANNLDEYGAIDEKVQTIIDSAHAEDVPIFYEFSKRMLGKALGKTIKVGVAGVQNADGAHQQFKKLMKIATTMS